MMQKNWVSPHLVYNLDATMHQREILRIRGLVQRHSPRSIEELESHVTKGTTPTTIGFSYQPMGVRFVRSQNVLPNSLAGNFEHISAECHSSMKRSQVMCGDVLINLVGASIGRAAVYPYPDCANINQAVGRIRFSKSEYEINPRFVASWINTSHAQALIFAEQSGQARDNFDLHQLRELPVPSFVPPAQKYIGEKVKKAENLGKQAAAFLESAINLLEELVTQRFAVADAQQLLGVESHDLCDAVNRINGHVAELRTESPDSSKRSSSTVPIETLTNRLDASYYTIEAITNEKLLKSLGAVTLRSLIATEKSGYGVLPDSNDYVCTGNNTIPLIRGGDLSFGRINSPEVFVPSNLVTNRAITQLNDVLLLIKGACIDQAEGVGIVGTRDTNRLFNGSCYRITAKDVAPHYLVAFFQTSAFLIQKRREIANTGISYNSEESIHQYLVPRFTSPLEKLIADLVQKSLAMSQFAEALTRSGKYLVEGLIEGQVSEAELADAQRALENGDRTKDWAILSRMTEAGIHAEDCSLLFTDSDALYEAIKYSHAPLHESGDPA
jgi:type I restriction enzyme S subunit